jgi:hypothetical protein
VPAVQVARHIADKLPDFLKSWFEVEELPARTV